MLYAASHSAAVAQSFSWDNAIIYFVMTDRFVNGDDANDHAYGRALDGHGNPIHSDSPARFFGGDLVGLKARVDDGYFNNLGVNVLWITSPLEQVRGWVGGGSGSYPAYAYHGYWPLDFTRVDRNLGTAEDLEALVQACHARGIRVLMDVVINHAGYNTLRDMVELGFGAFRDSLWQNWSPGPGENWHAYHDRFINYGDSAAWASWWSGAWARAGIAGYPPCGSSDQTTCTSSLPDFRTESEQRVALPRFLEAKWARERPHSNPPDSLLATDAGKAAVRQHVAGWLVGWVRRLGIDGFRLDTARNLDMATMRYLKSTSVAALRAWKSEAASPVDDADFWMVGEVFGHGVERTDYFDNGLDAVLNFHFQRALESGASLDSLFAAYSARLAGDPTFNVVSYLSSHDTHLFDRGRLFDAATALMLVPGNVQIFYGDETGRPPGPPDVEVVEQTRSPMNWDSIDASLLAHWQKLGQFRARHPSIAAGRHETLSTDPYTFHRASGVGSGFDQVIVVLAQPGRVRVNVSRVFGDNALLRDAYTGKTVFVSYGMVYVDVSDAGVVLLEEVR